MKWIQLKRFYNLVSNIPWKTKIPQKLWKMDFPQLLWKTGFYFILWKTELQLRTYGKLVSNSVIEDDVHDHWSISNAAVYFILCPFFFIFLSSWKVTTVTYLKYTWTIGLPTHCTPCWNDYWSDTKRFYLNPFLSPAVWCQKGKWWKPPLSQCKIILWVTFLLLAKIL